MGQRLSDIISAPADNTVVPKSMRLGDVMAQSPIQYSDDEEKDLFSAGVIAVPSAEDRAVMKNRGPIGAFEAFARNAKPQTFIPIVGQVSEGLKTASLLSATNRLQANDYKENIEQRNRDAQLLADEIRNRVEEQERGYSWGGKVINVVKEMPAFMAEFMATGGVATGGRMAARKGAEAVLNRVTDKAMTRIITKKVAGTVGSIASRTAALGTYKVPISMAQKEASERIELSDKGVRIYDAGKTKPFTSLIKSVGDVAFEISSEQAGGTIRKVVAPIVAPVGQVVAPVVNRLSENRMVKAVSMLAEKLKVGGLAKEMADKAKFDGILEEYGEERWGNFLRAVANVDDFGAGDNANAMDRVIASLPSMEESLVELGAFSIPAVGFAGASFYDRVKADNLKGVDDALITKVADEILVDHGLKEPATATTEAPVASVTSTEPVSTATTEAPVVEPTIKEGVEPSPQVQKKQTTPAAPKMVEKEFVEEYEEAPESLEKEYARAHRERTETLSAMVGDKVSAGKKRKGRGFELSATLRQYRGEPTATEIKNEIKKLNAMTVGKTVQTSKGTGVITKNPAYGKVQVDVNGVREAFVMEDVAPINTTKDQAIASLKAKAEKSMLKYLKDIGREYKPQSIKRTRVVKRMVPAEQFENKPVDVVETAPEFVERTDDQIRAEALSAYLSGTTDTSSIIFSEDIGETGPNRVIGYTASERPKWFQSLGISMKRATSVLDKYAKGEALTETEQRDFENIMKAGKSTAKSMLSESDILRTKRIERLIASGATQEEAQSMADMEAEQDLMDAAGIIDDEAWVADLPVETAPVLETPKTEQKVAKAASDVATKMVEDGFKNLPELEQAKYSPIEKKAKLEAAAELLRNDYERAKRIAFGEEASGASDAQIVYNAVKNRAKAEGDMDTQIRLAESSIATARSEAAQTLSASGFDNGVKENDPVSAMQEISSIRKAEVSKKINVAKETKSEVKSIKDMTKQELRKLDWDSFVKSIEC